MEKQVIRPLTARELEKQPKTESKALIIEAMEGKEDGDYAVEKQISSLKRLRTSGGACIGHEIDLAFLEERRPRRLA